LADVERPLDWSSATRQTWIASWAEHAAFWARLGG